jgi:putative transposase
MSKQQYPCELTDAQWSIIKPLIPPAKTGGRPREVDMRYIVNGILYINRGGCAWRLLPKDYGPWETAYGYFRGFTQDGTWQHIHDRLRKKVRKKQGRKATPSAAIIDSQSVKTTEKGGPEAMMRVKRSMAEKGISL